MLVRVLVGENKAFLWHSVKGKKLLVTRMLTISQSLACLVFLACISSEPPDSNNDSGRRVQQGIGDHAIRPKGKVEELIWSGESSGYKIRWTSQDLYLDSTNQGRRLWSPFVEEGFKDFSALYTKVPGRIIEDCTYERDLALVSVVGTLISFQDEYSDFCGGAHPSEDYRFLTIDLSQPGEFQYKHAGSPPLMTVPAESNKKIPRLTDYFNEEDLLAALIADRLIQKAITSSGRKSPPKTLEELNDLLANENYRLGDSGLALSSDFLTRFAFHHIEGNKVAIRLSLSSTATANQSEREQIGLLIPIPERLRMPLRVASERREGFLMRDSEAIAHGKSTTFSFPK
jgi:hypothetical protein